VPRKISLAIARERGLAHYFTGAPCSRGHVCERIVSSRGCMKCASIAVVKYAGTKKGRKKRKAWRTSPRGKEVLRLDNASPKGRERRRVYLASPKGRLAIWRYNESPKGKTDALIMDFCQEVGKGWGAEWKGILFRQSHPQLRDVIEKSKKWIKRIWPEAIYNEVKTMHSLPSTGASTGANKKPRREKAKAELGVDDAQHALSVGILP
jgi:hypothetical protein